MSLSGFLRLKKFLSEKFVNNKIVIPALFLPRQAGTQHSRLDLDYQDCLPPTPSGLRTGEVGVTAAQFSKIVADMITGMLL